ncbi:MAG TPA: PAS domain S-box protein [Kofleriaceae bacterium]|jgi:PAS domain S-box-containing protein
MERTNDPYRAVFDHLSTAAAHCALRRGDLEVVHANPAFAPYRELIAGLSAPAARTCANGQPEKLTVNALAVTIHPVGSDEVMILVEDVSARERLEQSSRISQDRFETAFHGNAAAMVIARQSDLRIFDVNPRWLQMFGATREQVIGKTSMELGLIAETDAQERIAQHRQFADGYDIELALRTTTGKALTVLASARPIEIEEGTCTLTTLIDITGRKQAEEAFAVAFDASPAGMMLVNEATDAVIAVNNRLVEMSGYPRDAFVGRTSSEVNLARKPTRAELLAALARDGRLRGVEAELNRVDGTTLPSLLSTELITLGGTSHRITVFTDISARKRHEQRLLTQHEVGTILAAAQSLDAAVPPVIAALCGGERWDCGAVWLPSETTGGLRCRGVWSRDVAVTARLATHTLDIVPGQSDGILSRVLTTARPELVMIGENITTHGSIAFAAGMRRVVAFPILRGTEVLGVAALAAREGDATLDAAKQGLLDSIGRMLGLFVERTRAEGRLRELNAELEQRVTDRTAALENSNRDLEAFSSSVSHDLRAPLRSIEGFTRILLEDYGETLPAEATNLLERINASGIRLRELILGVLAFSRLGRHQLARGSVNMDLMVRAVVDELLANHKLDVHLEVHPLGTALADPTLLRTVWQNLIDNALKYSRGRERIEIEIGRETKNGETFYYVRDNGVGFDMRHAQNLFGVFQRLHAGTEFEGTGIGLANVRRILERHNGRITATSAAGEGSRFEFTLGTDPATTSR